MYLVCEWSLKLCRVEHSLLTPRHCLFQKLGLEGPAKGVWVMWTGYTFWAVLAWSLNRTLSNQLHLPPRTLLCSFKLCLKGEKSSFFHMPYTKNIFKNPFPFFFKNSHLLYLQSRVARFCRELIPLLKPNLSLEGTCLTKQCRKTGAVWLPMQLRYTHKHTATVCSCGKLWHLTSWFLPQPSWRAPLPHTFCYLSIHRGVLLLSDSLLPVKQKAADF